MANSNPTTPASAFPSTDLNGAIAAHVAAQSRADGSERDETAFNKALSAADDILWQVAETPCANDAEFFAKLAYLLARARGARKSAERRGAKLKMALGPSRPGAERIRGQMRVGRKRIM